MTFKNHSFVSIVLFLTREKTAWTFNDGDLYCDNVIDLLVNCIGWIMVSCDGVAQEIVILAGELKIVIVPNEIKMLLLG